MPDTIPTAEKVAVAPAICPVCGSANVQTTSKTIDASSYWRCRQCGEVWNILRREAGSRYRYSR